MRQYGNTYRFGLKQNIDSDDETTVLGRTLNATRELSVLTLTYEARSPLYETSKGPHKQSEVHSTLTTLNQIVLVMATWIAQHPPNSHHRLCTRLAKPFSPYSKRHTRAKKCTCTYLSCCHSFNWVENFIISIDFRCAVRQGFIGRHPAIHLYPAYAKIVVDQEQNPSCVH